MIEHVHAGDIFRERDTRFVRLVKVLTVSATHAVIQTVDDTGQPAIGTRPTQARLDRFGKGYVRP